MTQHEQKKSASTQSTTEETMEQVQDKAKDVAETAKERAGELSQQAADQARTTAASRKEDVVMELEGVAHALRDVGDQLHNQEQDMLARYSDQAAQRIEQFHDYLDERTVDDLVADTEDFARRRPEIFLGGAFAIGLLVGRFLKSSSGGYQSSRYEPSRFETRPGSPYEGRAPVTSGHTAGTTRRREGGTDQW